MVLGNAYMTGQTVQVTMRLALQLIHRNGVAHATTVSAVS